jgi:hypothetical protein
VTIRQFVSNLFQFRIKEGEQGWEEASQLLGKTGQWSLTGSPKKFEEIIIELCKRIERLEAHGDSGGTTRGTENLQPPA